jgi:hypothetical protein
MNDNTWMRSPANLKMFIAVYITASAQEHACGHGQSNAILLLLANRSTSVPGAAECQVHANFCHLDKSPDEFCSYLFKFYPLDNKASFAQHSTICTRC